MISRSNTKQDKSGIEELPAANHSGWLLSLIMCLWLATLTNLYSCQSVCPSRHSYCSPI